MEGTMFEIAETRQYYFMGEPRGSQKLLNLEQLQRCKGIMTRARPNEERYGVSTIPSKPKTLAAWSAYIDKTCSMTRTRKKKHIQPAWWHPLVWNEYALAAGLLEYLNSLLVFLFASTVRFSPFHSRGSLLCHQHDQQSYQSSKFHFRSHVRLNCAPFFVWNSLAFLARDA